MSIEHKLEKIANEAIAIHNGQFVSLNDAVREVMKKYALNRHETARVCERVNHLKFGTEFAMDKTATFKIARADEVIRPDIELKEDVYTFGKIASDNSTHRRKVAEEVASEAEYLQMKKLAEHASEVVPQLHYERDNLLQSIKQELIALTKLGESKESMYKLVSSLTKNDGEFGKESFDMFMNSLEEDGYDMPFAKHASDMNSCAKENSYPSLEKKVKEYLEKTAEQVRNELGYEYCISKLAQKEDDYYISSLEKKMQDSSIMDEAFTYSLAKTGGVLDAFRNYMTSVPPGAQSGTPSRMDSFRATGRDAARTGANLAARVLIGGAVLGAGVKGMSMLQDVDHAFRRNRLKKSLREAYPEVVGDIPERTYNNLFDGLTQLQPTLLKAPYPLAEMIRHQAEYGTIDPKTSIDLMTAWSKTRSNPVTMMTPYAPISGNNMYELF